MTWGDVLLAVSWTTTIIAAYYAIKGRVEELSQTLRFSADKLEHTLKLEVRRLETTLEGHARSLQEHASRLDRYEAKIVEIMSSLNRLLGRVEEWDGADRRKIS